MQGRFIVFEGVEGGGKTTQLQRTREWLQDSGWLSHLQAKGYVRHLEVTREPGGTELGVGLRQLLLEPPTQEVIHDRTELLMYAADRAQHVEVYLRPQLAAGDLILCDRYTDSTIAYQGYGRELDLALIHQLNQIATNGLTSDLTLWLDLDAKTGLARTLQRGKRDRMEQADLAFHQRVQQGFATLAKTYPDRIVTIDANQPEELVAAKIRMVLDRYLTQWYGARQL
ncbi:MAG TPA: dTMP kinase [Microcoleaceae cyanobacterium]|jgi:dTMP kinase